MRSTLVEPFVERPQRPRFQITPMSRISMFVACLTISVAGGLLMVRDERLPQLVGLASNSPATEGLPDWPPKVGDLYPDWRLTDTGGRDVHLSSFRGKVTLIELIGIPCKGCQAFSGGHEYGPFDDVRPQPGLKSLAEYFPRFAGMQLDDPRIQFVQIILFDKQARNPPTIEEARRWEQHFRLHEKSNAIVLVGRPEMRKSTTISMIPGFHLIDRDFKLRVVAGKPPRSDLYSELLTKVPSLVDQY